MASSSSQGLFGGTGGTLLRKLAIKWDRSLLWAFESENKNDRTFTATDTRVADPVRF